MEKGMKKPYEAPMLIRQGEFRRRTGFLQDAGNDRFVLSKN
ncbi:keywimysin-related RiPP [Streptomyces sp. 6N223]